MTGPGRGGVGPTSFLAVGGITVAYGSNVVLDDLAIEVEAGETVAVVGPSGSGKSTLLRAIAGLEPLRGGRILLDGVDLATVPPHRRGVGYMFQDHALFTHLNVTENIAYGLTMAGAPREKVERRVTELLELVGLSGYERRAVDELSGGESQRVALARALAPEPRLLLLDEPLGSLDRVLRDQLVTDLDRLLGELGQTALHVTHDQAEAFALADRVAVLTDGRLDRIDTPANLWRNPRSRFVAEFLGRPNIWPVVDGESPAWVVVPVEAVRVLATDHDAEVDADESAVPVLVRSCRFRDGGYTVVAEVDGVGREPTRDPAPGWDVTLRSPVPYPVAQPLTVAIDHRAAVALTSSGDH